MTTVTSYKLSISDADLNDLTNRVRSARWPVEVDPDTEERGIRGRALKRLADHWATGFDWRAQEALINRYEQVMVEHEGVLMHAFHIRSPHADAVPLVLCHGWPSSGIEYLKLIEPLTNPTAHGGVAADAFHLVIPTAPGFGLSPAPTVAGWNSKKTASAVAALLDHLGYDRFAVHGTDMGSDVAGKLDVLLAGRAIGIHVATDLDSVIAVSSFMGGQAAESPALNQVQRERVKALLAGVQGRNGYIAIQTTRPKTLGYALNDSPIGQLAWIAEKFAAWTDSTRPTIEEAVDLDQFLTTVSLYWFNGGGAASANALWEAFRAMDWAPPSNTPNGVAVFGADELVRLLFDPEHKVKHWTEYADGGHFPAMEQPEALAGDLRQFFRTLR
jgi:pimeloyl-ACP methyl ester carboxylesterase